MSSSPDGSDSEPGNVSDAVSLNAWVRKMSRYSMVLTTSMVKQVVRWAVLLTICMQEACDALTVKDNVDADPVCFTYQSDGWSAFVSEAITHESFGTTLTRYGRTRKEFLLERLVVKTMDTSRTIHSRMMLRPPRPLDDGQSCWNIMRACSEFYPTPRGCGHTGLAASVYLQDGLFSRSFVKHNHARHRLWYEAPLWNGGDEDDKWMQKQTDLVFGGRCRAHIGSSAVRWGAAHLASEKILEDVHVAVRSLRQTAHIIHRKIDQFLTRAMAWDTDAEDDWSEREKFWEALGVDVEAMEKFAEVRPRWNPTTKQLLVNPTLEHDAEAWGKAKWVVLYTCRWANFSDTRLAAVGDSCRKWLLSEAVGLASLYEDVWADKACSHYFGGGYWRLKHEQRLWMTVAAMAFRPVEDMVLETLEDDRFLARHDMIKDSMGQEVEYIMQRSRDMWDAIASAGGLELTGTALRAEVLHAMHVSMGYTYIEAFLEVARDPWRMTQGDVKEKVAELKRRPEPPEDYTMRQMWSALQAGVMEGQLERLLLLVKDTSLSALLVEKGHASGSNALRRHQCMNTSTLCARQVLAESRALCARNKDAVELVRLQELLAKTEGKKSRLTPQNAYCSHLMRHEMMDVEDAGEAWEINKNIVKNHNRWLAELTLEEKNHWAEEAAQDNAVGDARIKRERDELTAKVRLLELRQDLACAFQKGVPNTLSSMRLSTEQLAVLAARFDSDDLRGAALQRAWTEMISAPAELSHLSQSNIYDMEQLIDSQGPKPDKPWWLPRVVRHREHFVGAALSFEEDCRTVWLFLMANAKEYYVAFLRLTCAFQLLPCFELLTPGDDGAYDPLLKMYNYEVWDYASGSDLPHDGPTGQVWVLPGFTWGDENTVQTRRAPVLIEDFMQPFLRRPAAEGVGERHGGGGVSRGARDLLLAEFPWLTPEDFGDLGNRFNRNGPGRADNAAPARRDARRIDAEVAEEEAARVMAELLERRETWAFDWAGKAFYVRLPGGIWTAEHLGQSNDGAVMYARAGTRVWCARYSWPKQKGFYYNRFPEATANMLAREWALRGSHWWDIWHRAGEDIDYHFTQADIDTYIQHREYVEWCLDREHEDDVWREIMAVNASVPTNP